MKIRPCLYFLLLLAIFAFVPATAQNWNDPNEWKINLGDSSSLNLSKFNDSAKEGIKAEFELRNANHSYVNMQLEPKQMFDPEVPVVFNIKTNASCDLELKMLDEERIRHI